MTRNQILDAMLDCTGHPSSGPLAEWLPALADAVDAALNPTAAPDSKADTKAKRYDTAEVDSTQ
jgi:hypothetical protein